MKHAVAWLTVATRAARSPAVLRTISKGIFAAVPPVAWRAIPLAAILFAGLSADPAQAQERSFKLAADAALIDNGFAQYILPRFSLKAGTRIELTGPDGADALLGRIATVQEGAAVHAVFAPADGGDPYRLVIRATPASDHAVRFLEWLRSEIGRRTVERFTADGVPVYVTAKAAEKVEEAPNVTGDPVRGEALAFGRCGRCHVINRRNRFGGIGSTPSFGAMKTLPHWQQRFQTFWTLNPHPAFTQIDGVTEPFDPAHPSPIAPVRMTLAELEDLLAFVHTIAIKDLGEPLHVK